jgi:hypothetical protein
MKIYISQTLIFFSLMGCSISNTNKNSSLFLKDEIKSLLTRTKQRESIATEVSSVFVGWHLDHILLTINQIYSALEKSNPEDFCESLNTGKSMLFAFDEIPLRQAKAIENVRPPKLITIEKNNLDYELAKSNILQMDSLPNNAYFTHPDFGVLKKDEAK